MKGKVSTPKGMVSFKLELIVGERYLVLADDRCVGEIEQDENGNWGALLGKYEKAWYARGEDAVQGLIVWDQATPKPKEEKENRTAKGHFVTVEL